MSIIKNYIKSREEEAMALLSEHYNVSYEAVEGIGTCEGLEECEDKIKSHHSQTINGLLRMLVEEIKTGIGYGKFGFTNKKGETCIKLDDFTSLLQDLIKK